MNMGELIQYEDCYYAENYDTASFNILGEGFELLDEDVPSEEECKRRISTGNFGGGGRGGCVA